MWLFKPLTLLRSTSTSHSRHTGNYETFLDDLRETPEGYVRVYWPNESQKHYEYLLSKANTITIVSEGSYSSSKMMIRNKVMVDNCDILIVIWDGTSGGTKNCIKYAKGKKPIIFINI